ncbi:MAG TPA: ATP-binding cassette domain-containing protein [Firmicutes bacterium]|nr:ATP-binding cassette domain-containing protein [Bacillota bacterium]
MKDSLITVEQLTVGYKAAEGTALILRDVSFQVAAGTRLAVVGAVGSGKTTLLKVMGGLLRPLAGRVIYDGRDAFAAEHRRWLRERVGISWQQPEQQLFAETVLTDVMFAPLNLGYSPEAAKEAAEEALRSVGLPEELWAVSPFHLSGGERRLAAMAGTLATRPQILLLDEPTAGLDPAAGRRLLTLLGKKVAAEGLTCLLATHDRKIASLWCDEIVVLHSGRLVFHGRSAGWSGFVASIGPSQGEELTEAGPNDNSGERREDPAGPAGDPAIKIAAAGLLAAATAISGNWLDLLIKMVVATAIYALHKIPLRSVGKLLRPFWPLVVAAIIFGRGGESGTTLSGTALFSTVLFSAGGWTYTTGDLVAGLWVGTKFMAVILAVGWLGLTTTPTRLTRALSWWLSLGGLCRRLGANLAMAVFVAMRFYPVFVSEAERIRLAQESRGISLVRGLAGIGRRITSLVIPLSAALIRRTETLATALVLRGYRPGQAGFTTAVPQIGRFELLLMMICGLAVLLPLLV